MWFVLSFGVVVGAIWGVTQFFYHVLVPDVPKSKRRTNAHAQGVA